MHSHSVSPATGRKLQFSLWITAAFIVVEFAAGIKAQSLALLSDAGHNFTDALALALGLVCLLSAVETAKRNENIRLPPGRRAVGFLERRYAGPARLFHLL